MTSDRQVCLAAGMDEYLTKPIVDERLVAVLNNTSHPEATPAALGEGADKRAWRIAAPVRQLRRVWEAPDGDWE